MMATKTPVVPLFFKVLGIGFDSAGGVTRQTTAILTVRLKVIDKEGRSVVL